MAVTHLQQPPGSSVCGHCCVAMAAGVPLEEVIQFIGHKRATRPKELMAAMEHFGVKVRSKGPIPMHRGILPKHALLKVNFGKVIKNDDKKKDSFAAWGHAVLLWDGKIHDPGNAEPGWNGKVGYPVSFIPLTPPVDAAKEEAGDFGEETTP